MIDPDSLLEIKLCFLHDCLAVESARDVLSSAQYSKMLEDLYEDKPLRDYVQSLVVIDNCFSKNYIDTLTKIRIFLLGS